MDPISQNMPQFGEILEQGKQTAVNSVKATISDTTNAVAGQIGMGKPEPTANPSTGIQAQIQNQITNQATGNSEPISLQDQDLSNPHTSQMVQDYYASSDSNFQSQKPQTQADYENQQKILEIRKELHQQTYVDPLFAYEHKKEERPAEIAEKEEEQKKMMELESNQQKSDQDIATFRAQRSAEVKLSGAG
jgi:hypothetical protein